MTAREEFISRYHSWLKHMGFDEGDPFAVYEAGKEQAHLSKVFVDRSYLHDVIGNPAYPQTAVLLAGRGEGKTATREMVAYAFQEGELRRRALAVHYDDFSKVLERTQGDPAKVAVRQHVEVIAEMVIQTLVEDVPALYFDALSEFDRRLLLGFARAFGDPISRLKLQQLIKSTPSIDNQVQDEQQIDFSLLSPRQTLETLARLVSCLKLGGKSSSTGYEAIMILVDRVDEGPGGIDSGALMLKPLFSNGPLLETPRVAFKFFLPLEMGRRLSGEVGWRPDRLMIKTINWDRAALRSMVERRLQYFSNHEVESLAGLCVSTTRHKVMDKLIDACNGSPRTLLRLCQKLFLYHVEHSDDLLISGADVNGAIMEFERETDLARSFEGLITSDASDFEEGAPGEEVPSNGLFIDRGGHVWLDGKLLSPTFPDLEFRLLKALYQHLGEIVTHEDLLHAVWRDDELADPQNLRKLVGRVRERLEPGVSGANSRFIKSAKGRGYWLQPAPPD